LTFEDLFQTGESWPFPDTLNGGKIARRVGGLLLSEALRMIDSTIYPEFVKRQIRVLCYPTESFTELRFETITTCPACCGLNQHKLIIGRPTALTPPSRAYITLKDVSIKHKEGGYRATSAEEAVEMVNRVIKKLGASITIEKTVKNVLDKVTPTYNSSISDFYKKDFPLLIGKKNQWGKGITEKQAYLSGSFELFERICWNYYGNVEMIRASYGQVEDIAINVERTIGTVYLHHDIERFDPHVPIDWVWGYSLVKEKPILVPASIVYSPQCKFMGRLCRTHSGGLAAGTTIEDAILQGLMETIEHDAWMIWQANAITMPQVRNETIDDPAIARIIDEIEQVGYRLIIRYQTTDIQVPVFLTWLINEKDYSFYAWQGYGANLDKGIALKRSITEANQSLPSIRKEENLTYMTMNNQDILDHKWSLFYLYHFNQTDIFKEGHSINFKDISNLSTSTITGDIKKTIALIRKAVPEADIVVVNLEQEVFKIPVVKIITVGLQNIERPLINFPGNRLFRIPKALGYRDYELSYKELFNNRYPH
jgi:ribosomal protein S12 methylthiotransferase accessory factor